MLRSSCRMWLYTSRRNSKYEEIWLLHVVTQQSNNMNSCLHQHDAHYTLLQDFEGIALRRERNTAVCNAFWSLKRNTVPAEVYGNAKMERKTFEWWLHYIYISDDATSFTTLFCHVLHILVWPYHHRTCMSSLRITLLLHSNVKYSWHTCLMMIRMAIRNARQNTLTNKITQTVMHGEIQRWSATRCLNI